MAPILDRREYFDERSRDFPVAPLLAGHADRVKTVWEPRPAPLDQGSEGACVGFAWSHELAATPHRYEVDDSSAFALYRAARDYDAQMGNHWDEGASLLAGAKAAKAGGWLAEYRWAFGLEEVLDTLVQQGPVVLGIGWYEQMYSTDPSGLVVVDGDRVGGHAIMANGYWPDHPEFGDVVIWTNSWGRDYGLEGCGFIRTADLDRLLRDNGEACIPLDVPVS